MDNNKKLTTCKTCGKEVAKSAKICLNCGANLKNVSIINVVLALLFVFLIFSIIMYESEKPKRVDNNNINTTKQIDDSPKFAVGESAELNNIIVTLKSVK